MHARTLTHTHIHTDAHACIHARACAQAQAHAHADTDTHTHTYTHTDTDTHTHSQPNLLLYLPVSHGYNVYRLIWWQLWRNIFSCTITYQEVFFKNRNSKVAASWQKQHHLNFKRDTRQAIVSCEAKKQHTHAYSGLCNHYSELLTRMAALNF